MTIVSVTSAETVAKKQEIRQLKAIKPKNVYYCGECLMPLEYCSFSGRIDKCNKWLEENIPSLFEKFRVQLKEIGVVAQEKKRQKRDLDSRSHDSKEEMVYESGGLDGARFRIDLKVAQRFFSKKFACGCSIQDDNERNAKSKMLVVRSGVACKLCQILPQQWRQVTQDDIKIVEYQAEE
uniref:Density-regulated protein n=1 Tax=Ditylenchus dipsaci TaxID=166011 RepID=A0A915CRX6_9BILA